jgi:hypothetical protein
MEGGDNVICHVFALCPVNVAPAKDTILID